ncbi:MAG: UDP-4-amino-4,6-dideoxy-N-acetyl-beta-L-altrosamine transaminase [Candidatus Omnitrophica bacterium]|nr:UDP-4-amino-4,6-dideoxy-N-acetyl-beta-L-altrosamine transaminase [Candidatus Omnitrophota bacterium]
MPKLIPYSRQSLDSSDIKQINKVLLSDFLTQGCKVKEFEKKLSDYCQARYAAVFSSGTAALHAAYFAAGVGKDDEVITSAITFLATSNAAVFLGAKPVFVDVEPDTANIDPRLIEKAVNKKTKAIIPVHYSGHPADLEKISRIAKKHNILVIEDACHALGAEYENKRIGSCQFSDMTVFSFHPVKSITTGEGGAVLTNNKDYYKKLVAFRQHGVIKDSEDFTTLEDHGWCYEMHYLGYNYRLTDIQCTLGISQLKKLDSFISKRRRIAEIYNREFADNQYFDLPQEKKYAFSSRHLYPLRLKDGYFKYRKQIFDQLRKGGLGVQIHYIPVYWQPYYLKNGYKRGICPRAEDFYQRELSIPLYPSMDKLTVKKVIDKLKSVFNKIEKVTVHE